MSSTQTILSYRFYLLFTFSAVVSDDSHCDDEDGEHETFLNVNAKVVCVGHPQVHGAF